MQHQTLNNTLVPSIVQVDTATRTQYSGVTPIDDTIPQNTEGTEIFSTSINLKSAASKVAISAIIQGAADTANIWVILAAFRGSNADSIGSGVKRLPSNDLNQIELLCIDSPATQGAVTYSLRIGVTSNSFYTNGNSGARFLGGAMKCTFLLQEILP